LQVEKIIKKVVDKLEIMWYLIEVAAENNSDHNKSRKVQGGFF